MNRKVGFFFLFMKNLIEYFSSIDFLNRDNAKKSAKKRAKLLDRKGYYIIKWKKIYNSNASLGKKFEKALMGKGNFPQRVSIAKYVCFHN